MVVLQRHMANSAKYANRGRCTFVTFPSACPYLFTFQKISPDTSCHVDVIIRPIYYLLKILSFTSRHYQGHSNIQYLLVHQKLMKGSRLELETGSKHSLGEHSRTIYGKPGSQDRTHRLKSS